ncbi:hypothetical protein M3Y95_01205400 [Aphelenchoides besseyi]|nr:hypothetical protein M3Y95_01205400 [Aphelenchoides besseyi]
MYSCFCLLLFATLSSASASKPCDGHVVMILDNGKGFFTKTMFDDQNNLVKKLFTDFNGFERLALGSYNVNTNLTNFGDFQSQLDVSKYVNSLQQNSMYTSWLGIGLWSVYNKNYSFDDKVTIVFFTSDVYDIEIPEGRRYAKLLQNQGVRLVLIGHGDSEEDCYNMDQLARITNDWNTVFEWNEKKDLPDTDYQTWFKKVLDCPGFEATTPEPPTTKTSFTMRTTNKPGHSDKPCDGRIVILLDASMSWDGFSNQQFEDQKTLVKKLFVGPYFDHFERLALGSYDGRTGYTTYFGDFRNEMDVQRELDDIEQSNELTYLKGALETVDLQDFTSISGDRVVVVIFVSDLEDNEIHEGRQLTEKLQNLGIRLVLVGHGNFKDDYVNVSRLARVTNDPSVVFKWEDDKRLPADDYQTWFQQVIGC